MTEIPLLPRRLEAAFLANAVAVITTAAAQLLFTPFYVRILGVEAYGIVGLFVVLQPVLQLLDLGISNVVNREVARRAAGADAGSLRTLVRTFEVLYWPIGLLLAAALWVAAGAATRLWSEAAIDPAGIRAAIRWMGIVVGLQWPIVFYQAVLRGMQRQVAFNAVRAVAAVVAAGSAALVLQSVSPTVAAFFITHAVVAAIHVFVVARLCWRSLPADRAEVRLAIVRGLMRYGIFVMLTNAVALAITHLDKVAVTRLLPLVDVGVYTLAAILPMGLLVVTVPIYNTIFPSLAAAQAERNESRLRSLYVTTVQITCALLLPPAIVVVLFAREILFVWLNDATVAAAAAPVAALLVAGSAFAALMDAPYMLQLAHGRSSIALRFACAQLVVYLPTVYFMTGGYGIIGAAFAWPLVNALYVAIAVPVTHRMFVPGASRDWLLTAFGPAFVATVAVAGGARLLFPPELSRWMAFAMLTAIAVASFVAAGAASPVVRAAVSQRWRVFRT